MEGSQDRRRFGRVRDRAGRPGSALDPEAERVTRRVEHHPYQLLGLMLCQFGTDSNGMSYRFFQIVDFEVEVDHHLLFRGTAGPDRRNEMRFGGEGKSQAAIGGSQRHPVGLDFPISSAKEPLIEVSQDMGVSGVKHDLRQRDTRCGR